MSSDPLSAGRGFESPCTHQENKGLEGVRKTRFKVVRTVSAKPEAEPSCADSAEKVHEPHLRVMRLDLSDDETAALLAELDRILIGSIR